MKKKYILISIFLFSIAGKAQINDLLQLSSSQLQFHAVDSFTQVSFQDCSFGDEPGTPQMPYWVVRYVIPFDQKVDKVVINSFSSQTLNGRYRIYPIQPPQAISEPSPAFVLPNLAIYNSPTPYPNVKVEVASHVYDKGYHIVTLYVYPLAYTPTIGQLRLYTSIAFTLQLTANNNQGIRPRFQSENMQQIIQNQICSMVRNPDAVLGETPSNVEPQFLHGATPQSTYFFNTMPEYIIITNNNDIDGNPIPLYNGKKMTDVFGELADWKTKKGIPTVVVTVDEIKVRYQGNDLQEQIRNYLKDIYENYSGCTYVLFGGDINIIPARFISTRGYRFPSDMYYTSTYGTWDADQDGVYGEGVDDLHYSTDFYYGRASVKNVIEAKTFVNKVIGYELSLIHI